MPDLNDLKKRQEARQLRKNNGIANVERAHAEQAALSDKQAVNQAETDKASLAAAEAAQREAAGIDRGIVPAPKKKPTRTETTRVAKAVHERQSNKDAQLVPVEVNVEREMDRWNGEGSPPLHVLNAMAEQADRLVRDEGKEVASAAGKAAYEVYVGKLKGKRNRHAHVRAQIAAGEAQIALAKQREQA